MANEFEGLAGLDALDAVAAGAAATDTAAAPVAAAPTAVKPNEKLAKIGQNVYRSMSTEDKESIHANTDKISMIHPLCAESQACTRQEGDKKGIPTYRVVGLKMKTEIDLDVPSIPFLKPPHDVKTIPDFNTIEYKHVPAGSEFVLTRVEAMYLFTLPQYHLTGYCAYNGQPKAVQLAAKVSSNFNEGGLPTPAFRFTDSAMASIKGDMESVDIKGANGNWELKPEYAEKFADLLVNRAGSRVTDGLPASKVSAGAQAAMGIYAVLSGQAGRGK